MHTYDIKNTQRTPSRKRYKLFWLLLLTIVLISSIIFYMYKNYSEYQAFVNSHTSNKETIVVEIQQGQTLTEIFAMLENDGIIEKKRIFNYPAYRIYLSIHPTAQNKTAKAGKYQIQAQTPITQLATIFSTLETCNTVKITIPEGLRIEEIAEIYHKALSINANFKKEAFISLSKNFEDEKIKNKLELNLPRYLEGYLFPDTYIFCENVNEKQIIERMLITFKEKVMPKLANNDTNFSVDQIINLASMIERESFAKEEKTMIAGILIKRLKNNVPLGVDATSQYGHGYSQTQNTWWVRGEELIKAVNNEKDPYNTRKRIGLPPTPISNPGLDSIIAVLNPKNSEYWYYLHDDCGKIHYSKTAAEHEYKANKYIGRGCETN